MKSVSSQIKILSASFLLIFFGYNGVQQYITTFFAKENIVEVGFRSLIFIYTFFVLLNPVALLVVVKFGAKKSMMIASLFYSFFIFSLLAKSIWVLYVASSLLGIAAAFLWIGQNSYLLRTSDKETYGKNSGFFQFAFSLGSGLGVVAFGFLVGKFSFQFPFFLYAFFPLAGFFILFFLKEIKIEQGVHYFYILRKGFKSISALRLSSIWFTYSFVAGLVMGIIPLMVARVLGVSFVGLFSSLFFVLPIFLSLFVGSLSDSQGRKAMVLAYYVSLVIALLSFSLSQQPLFLTIGIVFLALSGTIIQPVSRALLGDVSTPRNLEFLAGLFTMIANMGTVSTLVISQILHSEIQLLYLISLFIIGVSLLILYPLLKLPLVVIKEKISREIF